MNCICRKEGSLVVIEHDHVRFLCEDCYSILRGKKPHPPLIWWTKLTKPTKRSYLNSSCFPTYLLTKPPSFYHTLTCSDLKLIEEIHTRENSNSEGVDQA